MTVTGTSGVAVAAAAGGTVLLWSGIRGANLSQTLRSLAAGSQPSGAAANPVTADFAAAAAGTGTGGQGGAPGAPVISGGSAQAILQRTAAGFSWTGSEWTALSSLEMGEAGFNPRAKNPGSGALGLAQALGHGTAGTAGTLGNEYGANYGLSTAEAIAANSGDAGAQAKWMCGYIRDTYVLPSSAYRAWLSRSPHWY